MKQFVVKKTFYFILFYCILFYLQIKKNAEGEGGGGASERKIRYYRMCSLTIECVLLLHIHTGASELQGRLQKFLGYVPWGH